MYASCYEIMLLLLVSVSNAALNLHSCGSELSGAGENVSNYSASRVTYDDATNTATWTLSQPLRNDRVAFVLNGGPGGVATPGGLRLDGEWNWPTPGAPDFPSGDGSPGGDFRFSIEILPADAYSDRQVNAFDLADLKRRQNSTTTRDAGDGYSPFADVNGDGRINSLDLAAVRRHLNQSLPTGGAEDAGAAVGPAVPPVPPRTRGSVTKELFGAAPLFV